MKQQTQQSAKNARTALVLASIAVVFFVAYFLRRYLFA
ncbi:MAG: cytochrome oxidase small assembly protein [Burkholderiales bacterium]